MRYVVDNDLHIHSELSDCSRDPEQNKERILRYAQENGLHTICITDHFWDETVSSVPTFPSCYALQNYAHISPILPLPQAEGVRFLFGCETEMDYALNVGISPARMPAFDFIVIPITHFHFRGFSLSAEQEATVNSRADACVRRLHAFLDLPLPFHKTFTSYSLLS